MVAAIEKGVNQHACQTMPELSLRESKEAEVNASLAEGKL